METVEELCDYIALIDKAEKILEGPKKDIKETFRSNTFVIEHKKSIVQNGYPFTILSQDTIDDGPRTGAGKIHLIECSAISAKRGSF